MMCHSCGQDAILEMDGSAGNSVCTGCGTVLEENNIVSEISFGETSGGAAMVQGSYVGTDQTRARAPGGYRQQGGGQESREQTMANGRKKIQSIATGLRLPDRLSDSAQRYFNLAVNMKFVQGRRTTYVVAAVLYCACRMDKTSHMLIDFSDLLEINVFVLGSTYLKLIKELNLNLPTIDPSIYISRFAALLEFGDETQKVAGDATRLVGRMSRDWMNTGRRPAGVCGACLLLAARMNNFRRSVAEVVQVVKIADVTLRKRLSEFKDTPSGKLTVEDFRTLWLDEEAEPPAFIKSQKAERISRERREERLRKIEAGEYVSDSEMGSDDEGSRSRMGSIFPEVEGSMAPPPLPSSAKSLGKRKVVKRKRSESVNGEDASSDNEEHEVEYEEELNEAIVNGIGETLESEAGKSLSKELDIVDQKRFMIAGAMTNLNTSDRLDDLDEAELDCFILTEGEAEAKSRLWMEFNKQYLQDLADKQTGPDGELKPVQARRVRKKQKPRDSSNATASNPAEAAKAMLSKKRFSKKINYAAIDSLFGPPKRSGSTVDGEDDEEDDASEAGDEPPTRTGADFLADMEHMSARGRSATPAGTPIHIPRPTFGSSSRAGTPRERSMTPSIRHQSQVPSTPIAQEEAEEEEEEEEPHPVDVEEEEEEEDWRKLMNNGRRNENEEEMGYDDAY